MSGSAAPNIPTPAPLGAGITDHSDAAAFLRRWAALASAAVGWLPQHGLPQLFAVHHVREKDNRTKPVAISKPANVEEAIQWAVARSDEGFNVYAEMRT